MIFKPYEQYILDKQHLEVQSSSYMIAFDEVGRGSIFGPATITGVLFSTKDIQHFSEFEIFSLVKDSKQLTPKKRAMLYPKIKKKFLFKTQHISKKFIDKYNINLAIQKGVYAITQHFINYIENKVKDKNLGYKEPIISCLLIDGNYKFKFPHMLMPKPMPYAYSIIKGDQNCFSIACASIIAKEDRDNLLTRNSKKYLMYEIHKNKGYGTQKHFQAIKKYGISPLHRTSFLKI